MGDRAVVLFANQAGGIEPYAVYFHWAGQEGVEELYKAAKIVLKDRLDDISYFSARFVGLAHENSPGSTGLGLLPAPTPEQYADRAAMGGVQPRRRGRCGSNARNRRNPMD